MVVSERKHEEMEAKMGRSTRSRYEEVLFFFDEREYFYLCVVVYNTIDSLDESGMVVLKLRPASCSRLPQI